MVEGKWGGIKGGGEGRGYPWGEVFHLTALREGVGLNERELSIFKVFIFYFFLFYFIFFVILSI